MSLPGLRHAAASTTWMPMQKECWGVYGGIEVVWGSRGSWSWSGYQEQASKPDLRLAYDQMKLERHTTRTTIESLTA
ncbi:hypothetical protein TWF102_007224 [Orbilia oligospora]|uniref:Uncharacterized protein n=1 Tax=Orbilia oligospora TaxID=2813651 RepID=A0A7C8J583_ORBOL|nr:hypothetical protein TWF102_007224 [Orbilia oligospora]KAF3113120.1 hypothetical protein TWF706_010120 [Orbilia oligospora]KAF3125031.1 hypothetical protein TWF594_001726 [Orbilia oligospora]KAF3137566.1 hypothetical protein TWF703_004991 [Orbilia oligospora]